MTPLGWRRRREPATVRVRLGAALAMALLPVLILSAAQSALNFQRETRDQRTSLVAAAERSAATARARIEGGEVLLQTLAPGSVGLECADRLAEIAGRIPGYLNLIRFDENGRVACAAAGAPADLHRRGRAWFTRLAAGAPMVVTSSPGANYASEPAVLAAVRAEDEQGRFQGALAAVLSLSSLRPEVADRSLPAHSEVALLDRQGHYLNTTDANRFPDTIAAHLPGAPGRGSQLWLQPDRRGRMRVFAAAPLVGDEVYVVLSAPSEDLVLWAWLNPFSALALPLLAFTLALTAVWIVADRAVVRWIAYLQRVAAIYARGRFSVHPIRAEHAPQEIRELAETLGAMATTIAARDASLKESLAQKDALLREIHHRVKNNLQVISSLLNLQQRSLTDPAARAAMSDTRQRIAALALIYRSLYQGPDLKRVDLREFLEALIALLVSSEAPLGPPLRTEIQVDPLIIDPDRLAPLALFAVEAISNARKHGLAGGGVLTVRFQVREGSAELSICDTGAPGVIPKMGPGVGRTLMTAFARQLRGEARFGANPGGGLTAVLAFPTPGYVTKPSVAQAGKAANRAAG
ncbi:MAG: sensor histidine kinase [Caulobacterales bacterium]